MQITEHKTHSLKSHWKLIAAMYAGYGAMMVCRQMLTILSPALLADPALGLSKTNIADFAAWGTIGALFGKLIWGPLGDVIGGRKTFLIGLFLSIVCLFYFGLSGDVLSFCIASFLLYFSKSAGWPGMTKIVGGNFSSAQFGRVWGILSTSSRLSVVLGTLLFGSLLTRFTWTYVAWIAAIISSIVWITSRWFIPKENKDKSNTYQSEQGDINETSLKNALWDFAKSKRCRLMIVMMMLLTCLMAFLDFLPMYLYEVFKLSTGKASSVSSIFPFGCLAGLVFASVFYDKLGKKGVRRVLSIQLVIASLMILGLHFISGLEISETSRLYVAMILIMVFGFMIAPAYYIPSSIFSIEFGKAYAATLVCVIDAFGFAASAGFNAAGGRIADGAGWSSFIAVLFLISIFAAIFTWLFLNGEFRESLRKTALE